MLNFTLSFAGMAQYKRVPCDCSKKERDSIGKNAIFFAYFNVKVLIFQPKMSLQLYQVDERSYLLDFKSLTDDLIDGF